MHGVCNAVHEIDDAEEPHKAPALQIGVEREVFHNTGREYAYHEPRLELAVFAAGTLNDVAHDGVVQRVKYTRADHYSGYRHELCRREAAGKKHIGKNKVGKELIHHVSANRAEWEHYQIFLLSLQVVHAAVSLLKYSIILSFTCASGKQI